MNDEAPGAGDEGHEGHRNRLADETSPYLLQHAANPVDWYPWGDEAFERARSEDRPILLSVGYSSCHWCHVMAHESFEDPAIAALMNDGFVSIKVDREERPDVDAVYMTATQALTGQGGWPMTVFLTPDREPFFAGTYFPPRDAYGRPGFASVLENVARAWREDRARVLESATHITERLREGVAERSSAAGDVPPSASIEAVASLRTSFDRTWGGFGGAPKFPSPSTLEFLLMHEALRGSTLGGSALRGAGGDPSALEMVTHTLRRMAQGGMIDHLGGGFARYSVDERWLVPHFEKMLYDNAQLARVYVHASQLATDEDDRALFAGVARSTLDYLLREMRDPEGGFFSAQDADSEGIEGKYFTWTPAQTIEVLGADDGELFNAIYGVNEAGNFADPHHPEVGRTTVLHFARPVAEVASERGLEPEVLTARLEDARGRLLAAREQRVPPGLDDKVLTSWNGLALAAFAEAGRVLGEPRYLEPARANAEFVRATLWRDGALLHTYRQGVAKVDGLLEDYAYTGLGLVELYRATGALEWLQWAGTLLEVILERFTDRERGMFFDTPAGGETLLLRQSSTFDAATPSGNGAAALLALTLGRHFDRPSWEGIAQDVTRGVASLLPRAPSGLGTLWQVVELLAAPRQEVAVLGTTEARAPLEAELARRYLPHLVLAPALEGGGLPLLEGRDAAAGGATAFVCEQMACQLPVTTPAALATQLDALFAAPPGG